MQFRGFYVSDKIWVIPPNNIKAALYRALRHIGFYNQYQRVHLLLDDNHYFYYALFQETFLILSYSEPQMLMLLSLDISVTYLLVLKQNYHS